MTIAPVRKANIITVSYTSGSPQMAAAVLKKLGDLYLDKHLKLNHPTGASDFTKGIDSTGPRLSARLKI